MLTRPTQVDLHLRLLATIERPIGRAFAACIRELAARVDKTALIDALAAFDSERAIEALNISRAAFGRLYAELLQAHSITIQAVVDYQQLTLPVQDGLQDDATRQYVQGLIDDTINGLVEQAKEVVRQTMQYGVSERMAPAQMAALLIGLPIAAFRVNADQGRKGGLLGLAVFQLEWIKGARRELKQIPPSLDYFKRKLRDKTLDKFVRQAIKDDIYLSSRRIAQIIGAYAAKILVEQERRLALREAMKTVNDTRLRLLLKGLEGKDISLATKEWVTRGDNKVRHTHKAMNRQRVNIADKFQSPSGAMLNAPHDPDAPSSETAGCRCWFRARYKGRFI